MRVIYLDAGLANEVGHHSNFCRWITSDIARRGVPTAVFGRQDIAPAVRDALQAAPLFRWHAYQQVYRLQDPISGWLRDFELGWQMTLADLQRLPITPADLVFFASVQPTQFMAAVKWLLAMPAAQRPRVVIEFGTEPGLAGIVSANGRRHLEVPDPRRDPKALLFHHAGSLLTPEDLSRFTLMTYDATVSAAFAGLIGAPVATFPWPIIGGVARRQRRGRPITIAVLGHQRPDKGFTLVPEIVSELAVLPDVKFLIHDAAPDEMPEPWKVIRQLAARSSNIELIEGPTTEPAWATLLQRTDLMLCPYDPARYAVSHSGIVAECAANAIPCVVPAHTALATMTESLGGIAIPFAQWTASSIVDAVRGAITSFDSLADRAYAASEHWRTNHGPDRLADVILAQAR